MRGVIYERVKDVERYEIRQVRQGEAEAEAIVSAFEGYDAQMNAERFALHLLQKFHREGRPDQARLFRNKVVTHHHVWVVEETDSQGYVHRAEFTGPSAEREAKDYAARKGLPEVIADMEAIVRQFHAALEGRANG
jgi:hypothetical protein